MWKSKRNRPFTLVEILIVTGIICIIAVLVVVGYNNVYHNWSVSNTIAAMKNVHLALERFQHENGYLPTATKDAGKAIAWNMGSGESDPALRALARDLWQSVAPYAYKYGKDTDATQMVRVYDDFGSKPPSASATQINPVYYIYPYPGTTSFALISFGKDGVANGKTDDIIYLPAGLSGRSLPPGFYLVQVNAGGTIICANDDIEPLNK